MRARLPGAGALLRKDKAGHDDNRGRWQCGNGPEQDVAALRQRGLADEDSRQFFALPADSPAFAGPPNSRKGTAAAHATRIDQEAAPASSDSRSRDHPTSNPGQALVDAGGLLATLCIPPHARTC